MAARVVRDPAGGSKSLPDGAVHEGRGTRQLHDVTGKVQSAGLRIAVQSARGASCRAGTARNLNLKKKKNYFENKSKPRFRVNRIPWAGVKDPLSGAQADL